jgi:hypothetical protein
MTSATIAIAFEGPEVGSVEGVIIQQLSQTGLWSFVH